MFLVATFFAFLFLNVACNTIDFPSHRLSIKNFQNVHPEEDVEIFLNPISITNDHDIIDSLFNLDLKAEDINYYLYTTDNIEQAVSLRVGDTAQLRNSPFNSSWPTKIIIHGWVENGNVSWIRNIERNYLSIGNYNVICIDWFAGSAKEYLTSVQLTSQVAKYVAAFLEFLESETSMSFNDIHILGHSLGAHVAGITGKFLTKNTYQIGRITGLDPAKPAYETPYLKDVEERLDSTDAIFVDVIHTSAGSIGFTRAIGHADFYPNGGTIKQPGCPILAIQSCSHYRSHEYFSESIVHPNGFNAIQCANWISYQFGTCNKSNVAVMGEFVNVNTRGTFYLETNAEPPFGKGKI